MQIGFVGLGRMGGNMVHRILRDSKDHEVIAFDPSADARTAAEGLADGHGTDAEASDRARGEGSQRRHARREDVEPCVEFGDAAREGLEACGLVAFGLGELLVVRQPDHAHAT